MLSALIDIKQAVETDEYGTNRPDLNTIHLAAWMDSEEAF